MIESVSRKQRERVVRFTTIMAREEWELHVLAA